MVPKTDLEEIIISLVCKQASGISIQVPRSWRKDYNQTYIYLNLIDKLTLISSPAFFCYWIIYCFFIRSHK